MENKLKHATREHIALTTQRLLEDIPALLDRICDGLQQQTNSLSSTSQQTALTQQASAVLFLLGCNCPPAEKEVVEPCLILNKRSSRVRQPGDLCCPGGSIAPRIDPLLARLLRLPASPLRRWKYWPYWRKNQSRQSRALAVLFATGLRESLEEMRLNPLGVDFLGPLPPENLVMFRRTIYPLVCWVRQQKQFTLNWEVERIVSIPLGDLLDPTRYARFRLRIDVPSDAARVNGVRDFACFEHRRDGKPERLWGATFRIAMQFLEMVFGFQPPPLESLPTVEGRIDENYINPNT